MYSKKFALFIERYLTETVNTSKQQGITFDGDVFQVKTAVYRFP